MHKVLQKISLTTSVFSVLVLLFSFECGASARSDSCPCSGASMVGDDIMDAGGSLGGSSSSGSGKKHPLVVYEENPEINPQQLALEFIPDDQQYLSLRRFMYVSLPFILEASDKELFKQGWTAIYGCYRALKRAKHSEDQSDDELQCPVSSEPQLALKRKPAKGEQVHQRCLLSDLIFHYRSFYEIPEEERGDVATSEQAVHQHDAIIMRFTSSPTHMAYLQHQKPDLHAQFIAYQDEDTVEQ